MNDRRKPALPRDRFMLPSHEASQHEAGWIAYGMSRACPADASPEFRRGYAERREIEMSRVIAA